MDGPLPPSSDQESTGVERGARLTTVVTATTSTIMELHPTIREAGLDSETDLRQASTTSLVSSQFSTIPRPPSITATKC